MQWCVWGLSVRSVVYRGLVRAVVCGGLYVQLCEGVRGVVCGGLYMCSGVRVVRVRTVVWVRRVWVGECTCSIVEGGVCACDGVGGGRVRLVVSLGCLLPVVVGESRGGAKVRQEVGQI